MMGMARRAIRMIMTIVGVVVCMGVIVIMAVVMNSASANAFDVMMMAFLSQSDFGLEEIRTLADLVSRR